MYENPSSNIDAINKPVCSNGLLIQLKQRIKVNLCRRLIGFFNLNFAVTTAQSERGWFNHDCVYRRYNGIGLGDLGKTLL